MKKLAIGFAFVLSMAITAMAGEWTGYISDAMCAQSKGAKVVASESHASCAQACIKKGSKAVLVTEDGKIYQLTDQDKAKQDAGMKVTVVGKMSGDTIHVTDIKM